MNIPGQISAEINSECAIRRTTISGLVLAFFMRRIRSLIELGVSRSGMPPLKWSTHWDSFIPQLEDQRMAGRREKPEDIVTKLRQIEVLQGQGMTIADAARQIGVSEQTVYRWRKQYGGMSRDQLKRLKDLEKENQRLRRAVSDLTLDKQILSEAARGNF